MWYLIMICIYLCAVFSLLLQKLRAKGEIDNEYGISTRRHEKAFMLRTLSEHNGDPLSEQEDLMLDLHSIIIL